LNFEFKKTQTSTSDGIKARIKVCVGPKTYTVQPYVGLQALRLSPTWPVTLYAVLNLVTSSK